MYGDVVPLREGGEQGVDAGYGAGAGRGGRGADDDHAVAAQLAHQAGEAGADVGVRLVVVVEPALDHDEVGATAHGARRTVGERDPGAVAGAALKPEPEKPATCTAPSSRDGPGAAGRRGRGRPTRSRRSRRPVTASRSATRRGPRSRRRTARTGGRRRSGARTPRATVSTAATPPDDRADEPCGVVPTRSFPHAPRVLHAPDSATGRPDAAGMTKTSGLATES